MPYYSVGDYYTGDYYEGDGLKGLFGGIVRGIGGAVKGFITGGPAGAVLGGATALIKRPGPPQMMPTPTAFAAPVGALPPPPGGTVIRRRSLGPGGIISKEETVVTSDGKVVTVKGKKRKQMNPMNVRALRRASRRIDGFTRTARRALKHTGYMIVSRSSRRGGSPGVITRSEASRALRK